MMADVGTVLVWIRVERSSGAIERRGSELATKGPNGASRRVSSVSSWISNSNECERWYHALSGKSNKTLSRVSMLRVSNGCTAIDIRMESGQFKKVGWSTKLGGLLHRYIRRHVESAIIRT